MAKQTKRPKEIRLEWDWRPWDEDYFDHEAEWEDFVAALDDVLAEYGWLDRGLIVEASGFGWRNSSGEADINVADAEELLREILPKTDCIFHVWINDDEVTIRNWHHDSPMGNEYYHAHKADDLAREIAEYYFSGPQEVIDELLANFPCIEPKDFDHCTSRIDVVNTMLEIASSAEIFYALRPSDDTN